MLVLYQDRIDSDTLDKLRNICGGELNWKDNFPKLSTKEQLEFGKISFGVPVKNIIIKVEKNIANGYDIPVICAFEGNE